MDEFNLLPIYRNGIGEITSGIDIPIPDYCRKNCSSNKKCSEYYRNLESADIGIYQCPYGFNSYVFEIEGDKFIFSCLRIVLVNNCVGFGLSLFYGIQKVIAYDYPMKCEAIIT